MDGLAIKHMSDNTYEVLTVGWSQGEQSRIRGELNTLLKEQSEHDDDEQPQFTLQLQDEDDGTDSPGESDNIRSPEARKSIILVPEADTPSTSKSNP